MNEACKLVFPTFIKFEQELKRFIERKVADKETAKDITGDLVLKLYNHCEKLEEIKNTRAWLYKMAYHAVIDHFRTERKEMKVQEAANLTSKEDEQVKQAVENCLLELIQRLPEPYKTPLLMADLKDIPQKEIADKLEISYSNTKMRIQRGRKKLHEMFKECCSSVLE